jgi:hypothetical protein
MLCLLISLFSATNHLVLFFCVAALPFVVGWPVVLAAACDCCRALVSLAFVSLSLAFLLLSSVFFVASHSLFAHRGNWMWTKRATCGVAGRGGVWASPAGHCRFIGDDFGGLGGKKWVTAVCANLCTASMERPLSLASGGCLPTDASTPLAPIAGYDGRQPSYGARRAQRPLKCRG